MTRRSVTLEDSSFPGDNMTPIHSGDVAAPLLHDCRGDYGSAHHPPHAGDGALNSTHRARGSGGGRGDRADASMMLFDKSFISRLPEQFLLVMGREERAKKFRAHIKLFLAVLAVVNCVILMGFWNASSYGSDGLDRGPNGTITDHEEFDKLMLAQGTLQTVVAVVAFVALFFYNVSRIPDSLPSLYWVPRGISTKYAYFRAADAFEMCVWLIHCPIGVAAVAPRARHIDTLSLLRLYSLLHAGMSWSKIGSSPMSRALTSFLGLHLSPAAFIRYAMMHFKWRLLLPVVMFVFAWLAQIFCFAEDVSFFTACYWLTTTITTTGYGDITPKTTTGRIVAMCAMVFGLVVIAYFVKEVQHLLDRPPREAKVLDALTRAQLMREAKNLAASVVQAQWRARSATLTFVEKLSLHSDAHSAARQLRAVREKIASLVRPGDGDPQLEHMQRQIDALTASVNEMKGMLTQMMAAGGQRMVRSNNNDDEQPNRQEHHLRP